VIQHILLSRINHWLFW